MTVACARCHDHKFEPIPTADYYSLHGIFAATERSDPLDEQALPVIEGYAATTAQREDFAQQYAQITSQISDSKGSKTRGNNRSLVEQIRETDLASLLTFHPGGPARAMTVNDSSQPKSSYIQIRGDAAARGPEVPRRFLQVLDADQSEFPDDTSGRLQLAQQIVSPDNPLTARVIVNRVWGQLLGSYLVDTPSDFGLQAASPTHPELLDWLADDFVTHGWSIKHLVRNIVCSATFAQQTRQRTDLAAIDPENRYLWRANRRHLSIEMLRDSVLQVAGSLDRTPHGRAQSLWGDDYTHRRAIYGFINRFNLDPTLRAFDFPTPVQSQASRGESIVAPQALFTMNSPFVIEQARAISASAEMAACHTDAQRATLLFHRILQRDPADAEVERIGKFVDLQQRFATSEQPDSTSADAPWPLVAQSLMMSNEFQYID